MSRFSFHRVLPFDVARHRGERRFVSFSTAAIAIGTSVASGVATKAITGAMDGGGSSSGGGSTGGSGGGTTINQNDFSGAGLITPATNLAGSIEQAKIAQQTADVQSGDIESGRMNALLPLNPYNDAGAKAARQISDLSGTYGAEDAAAAMDKFTSSPGYQYQVEQGLRGIDAGAASKGMLRSGQSVKAEQTLANNLASLDFGNYISRLNALIQPGLSAATGIATIDTGAAATQAKIAGTLGANLGNAAGVGANAIGNLVGTGINALSKLGGLGGFGAKDSPGSIPGGGSGYAPGYNAGTPTGLGDGTSGSYGNGLLNGTYTGSSGSKGIDLLTGGGYGFG